MLLKIFGFLRQFPRKRHAGYDWYRILIELFIMVHLITFLEFLYEGVNWFSHVCLARSFGEYLNLIVKVIKKTLGTGRYMHLNAAISCC